MSTRAHWTSAKLGDLGEWRSGTTPSKANPAYWTDGTIPWVSPKAMKRNIIVGSDEAITQAAIDQGAAAIVPRGSVLIVVRSGILKHSVPIAVTAVDCVINQDLRALIVDEGVDANFVAQQLRWRAAELLAKAGKVGVTVNSLDQQRMFSFEVALAPPGEQARISSRVAELDDHCVAADAVLDGAPKVMQKLRSKAAARLLSFRQNNPSGETTSTYTVGELTTEPVRTGLSVRGAAEPPGIPSIRLSAMADARVDLSDVRYLPVAPADVAHLVLRDGDILVSRGSGTRSFVGRASLVAGADGSTIFPDKAFRIRLNTNLVIRDWFLSVWNSPTIRDGLRQRARTTAGIWMIPLSEVVATALPVPSLHEQEADLQRLAEIEQQIEGVRKKLERARRLLERVRSAIYTRAFSGALVDPVEGDGSASLLLETLMANRDKPKVAKPRRPRSPSTKDRLDLMIQDWPKNGQTFDQLRDALLAPYEEIKHALFERLAEGKLVQRFDVEVGHIVLVAEG